MCIRDSFTDSVAFLEEMAFPITFDGSLNNLHQLLATRTQSGNTLIDQLVAQDLIPVSNNYVFFNGKSLATFDTNQLPVSYTHLHKIRDYS